jgi:hypothetical protein
MKTTYLLFGGEASAIMDSTGNIHDAVRVGCQTRKFVEGDDITNLLADYTGWNDFWILTEEEFDAINELIEQR